MLSCGTNTTNPTDTRRAKDNQSSVQMVDSYYLGRGTRHADEHPHPDRGPFEIEITVGISWLPIRVSRTVRSLVDLGGATEIESDGSTRCDSE
jgi:hypothetical protein